MIPAMLERHSVLRWSAGLLAWTLFGLVVIGQGVATDRLTGETTNLRILVTAMLTSVWFWALLTPLLFRAFDFVGGMAVGWWGRGAAWILLFLLVHTLDSGFDLARSRLLLAGIVSPLQVFLVQFNYNAVLFAALALGRSAYRSMRRSEERRLLAARLERDLLRAELTALRTQLHPHFLFNTLNGIAEMVHRDPDAADAMTTNLGALLRAALDSADEPETTVDREIGMLETYLSIQRVRLGDRLEARVTVDDAARGARVPALILQPLVENAIKHGYSGETGTTRVAIAARLSGDDLRLTVEDGGPGPDGRAANGSGIGLRNVEAMLRRLYGDDHRFMFGHGAAGGALVEIVIPQGTVRGRPA